MIAVNARIKSLCAAFAQHDLDAMLISKTQNVRYLSDFTGTVGTLIVTNNNVYLFTDGRYLEQAKEQVAKHGQQFKVVKINDDYYQKLRQAIQESNISRLGFETDFISYEKYDKLLQEIVNIKLMPVKNITEQLRMIKDNQELQLIQQAVAIADQAWSKMLRFVQPGITEKELALELEIIMRRLGAEDRAFDIIVAAGLRGALPHGVASNRVIQTGDLVTIDFGALYQGYHSDITRNFVLGSPGKKQLKIYNLVLEAQLAGIKKVAAGVAVAAVDLAARAVIKNYGYAPYFTHSTGHGVGLAIHELPRISHLEKQLILQPGMVITIEPGIYLPDWGGVRIEDMVLVTETGCCVLTKTPKAELLII